MKNIWTFILILAAGFSLNAQTMKWIALPKGSSAGKCVCAAPSKSNLQCLQAKFLLEMKQWFVPGKFFVSHNVTYCPQRRPIRLSKSF